MITVKPNRGYIRLIEVALVQKGWGQINMPDILNQF